MNVSRLINRPALRRPISPRFERLKRMLSQYAPIDAQIEGYLRWTERCNTAVNNAAKLDCWRIDGQTVGYLLPELSKKLRSFPDTFQFEQREDGGHQISLNSALKSSEQRTEAVAEVTRSLKEDGTVSGWRNELYPVTTNFTTQPLLLMERAAAVHFGIKAYGVHINGFVHRPEGTCMWIARRSAAKPTWPGKLDHIVAGGQPFGISCADNVVKECAEEASVPKHLAQAAKPVGAVSYHALYPHGLKRDVLMCYDLELPPDFEPQPQDGEVESFQCLPIQEVARLIAQTDEIKDNCNLVILDFLIRHGHVTPDQPGYLQLLTGLRSGDCS